MKQRTQNDGTYAADAAVASGLAFLRSELEYAAPDLVKPLTSFTHARDITVEVGGGMVDFISAYATDYGTTAGNQYGLTGNDTTDIGQVNVSLQKGFWKAFVWQQAFSINQIDVKKLQSAKRNGQPAPFSLQEMLEDGVQLVWNKALEKVTYTGWLGLPGLVNNTNITSSVAAQTWATATPVQIQTQINFVLEQTVSASAFSLDGMADTILVPWSRYYYLMQPMTTGGFSSVLEFLLANNIARQNGIDLKIFPVADPWIATAGTGSTARLVAYRNNKKTVHLRVPQTVQKGLTIPTIKNTYDTLYDGCIGQVQFYRTQPFYYLDTI